MLNMFPPKTSSSGKSRVQELKPVSVEQPVADDRSDNGVPAVTPIVPQAQSLDVIELKVRLHRKLLDTINLAALDKMNTTQAESEIGQMVRELLLDEKAPLNATERSQLSVEIVDEVLGLGPLEPLIKDETVSDILVNTEHLVFVERFGKIERSLSTNCRFNLLRLVVSPCP